MLLLLDLFYFTKHYLKLIQFSGRPPSRPVSLKSDAINGSPEKRSPRGKRTKVEDDVEQVISTQHLLSPTPNSKSPHLRNTTIAEVDVASSLCSSSDRGESSCNSKSIVEPPKRGRGRPRKYPAVSAEPPTIKKRVAATIKVEENLKKTKQEVEAPSSPRQSRMRQPSRKLLESRQDLMASVFPHKRKHRSSISSSRTVSQSRGDDSEVSTSGIESDTAGELVVDDVNPSEEPSILKKNALEKKEDLIVDETDARRSNLIEESPFMSHTVPEVTTSSKSASRRRKVTINEPHVDVHMPSLAPCSPSSRNFVPSQSSIAIRDGSDLPEEHRPKERARPVGPHLIGLRSVQQEQHPAKRYLTPRPTPDIPQNAHFLPSGSRVPSPAEEHVIEEIVQDDMPQLDEKISGPSTYTVIDENGEEIVYEVGEGEMIEEVEYSEVPEGMEIVEAREVRNADGSTTIIHSVAPKSDIQQQDDKGSLKPVKQEPTHNEEEQNLVVDEDAPPTLQPEVGPTQEELITGPQLVEYIDGDMIRVQSPGGTQQYIQVAEGVDGSEIFVDANGEVVQMVSDGMQSGDDLRTVEFNFLDNKNICCGLCGEIVPYENLMTEHLPNNHPEVLGDGTMDLEEIPYEVWLRDKLYNEKKSMENGFRTFDGSHQYGMTRSTRMLRKVSQIRVNPIEMSLSQLEAALKKKMVEKMGRKVPVSLVDKQHARCGICNAVVSLNKKFEIVHLVRHFNAWHPSAHRCAGTWASRPSQPGAGKPLSIQDFAVIDVSIEASDNLQCIWCGMFMDRNALAMHFTEVHPEEIEVPKCLLCMQEIVINARLMEKYGEDFEVLLPDEFHVKCQKFEQTYSSESALDKAIERRVRKMQTVSSDQIPMLEEDDEEDEPPSNTKDSSYTNSRMQFGKRNKPKRSFVQPCFRQAIPTNSQYVESISECQWRCKLCNGNIFGAVISAGAIKHYKNHHPAEMENMQYELCKARLERISDGCMEFVHPQLVECLICNLTYALHKPYNMCRGIRHLKAKHPEMMPEYTGTPATSGHARRPFGTQGLRMGETIQDPEMIARFRNEYNVDFDKVQTLYGADGEPVYVLMADGEELDAETAQQLATSLADGELMIDDPTQIVDRFDDDDDDPYGHLAEGRELNNVEGDNQSLSSNDESRLKDQSEAHHIGSHPHMQREEGREEVVQQGFDHHVLNSGEMKNEIDATGNSLVMEKDDNVYQEEDEVELEHYEEVVEQQEYGDEEQVEYVSTEDYVNQTTNDVEEEMTDAQRQFIEAQQDLHFMEE